jgi:hypothetical protein
MAPADPARQEFLEDTEQPLIVLRENCRELGEVLPAARQLIGKSRSTQERGYSVAQITLEAVLIREDSLTQENLGIPMS